MKKIISVILAFITVIGSFIFCVNATETDYNVLIEGSCPKTGDVKVLTLVVSYKGVEPTDKRSLNEFYDMIYSTRYDKEIPTELVGSTEDSLRSFFYRQSMGKLRITGDIYEYEYDLNTKNSSASLMVVKAVDELGINPYDYDSNGDGYIDAIVVIMRNTKMGVFNGCAYCYPSYEKDKPIGRVAILSYISYDGTIKDYNNVLYHEFFHTLGFLDVYEGSGLNPKGNGDVYGTNSSTIHQTGTGGVSAPHKIELGWVVPIEITSSQYNLTIQSTTTNENVYVIKADETHWFVIEYCSTHNESSSYSFKTTPRQGVRVWKIEMGDTSRSGWYRPWSYFICKIDDNLDIYANGNTVNDLVEVGESIDLNYSTEYTKTDRAKTPSNYIYSGYTIYVNSVYEDCCKVDIHSNTENNDNNKNNNSTGIKAFFEKIIAMIKKLFGIK